MTQYVYGKNVVRQILSADKKVYEVIVSDTFKDKEIQRILKERSISVRSLTKKKMDALLRNGTHQGIAAEIDDYRTYDIVSAQMESYWASIEALP